VSRWARAVATVRSVAAPRRSSRVRAQITESIIGPSLLGLGLAIVAASRGSAPACCRASVIGLLLPTVLDSANRAVTHVRGLAVSEEALSLVVSGVLLLLYAGNLILHW
jgi:Ca2+:H+ antiporter